MQHIKLLVTEPVMDAECSKESDGDTPEPASSTPMRVAAAATPRWSGRVSQPPKALAHFVLY